MKKGLAIYWFRHDLRLSDNLAYSHASEYEFVLPIYIQEDTKIDEIQMGKAKKQWLYHSLLALNESLNGCLSLYQSDVFNVFSDLISRFDVKHIYWNRCYEQWRIKQDMALKDFLKKKGIAVTSYNSSLLWEPWTIKNKSAQNYKIFSAFYEQGCLKATPPREPIPTPDKRNLIADNVKKVSILDFNLLTEQRVEVNPQIGEIYAQKKLSTFISQGLSSYKEGRDYPGKNSVSGLSAHIHFGEISPHQIWHRLTELEPSEQVEHFCRELIWREFSYSQLFFNPDLYKENIKKEFDRFPWNYNPQYLESWKQGKTGIPMVDAGMRELIKSGYMHNRVRMIVASFLVKNLRLHWRYGAQWFWQMLFDADLASNSASWQWVAGSGLDAAPYFRIFNPILQAKKFDSDGLYIRKFIPELRDLPTKYLFEPWKAPVEILSKANIVLGKDYPEPIVDLKESRLEALEAYKLLKKS